MSSKNCTTSPSLSRYRYLRCAGRRSPKIDDSLYTVAPRKLCANLRLSESWKFDCTVRHHDTEMQNRTGSQWRFLKVVMMQFKPIKHKTGSSRPRPICWTSVVRWLTLEDWQDPVSPVELDGMFFAFPCISMTHICKRCNYYCWVFKVLWLCLIDSCNFSILQSLDCVH